MLVGSVAFAFPGVMPEAHASENTHLYVSAEVEGSFAGAQVIEIVVNDSNISEIGTAYGMPDVTVMGIPIIMAQGLDGAWYGYVVDEDKSVALDALYTNDSDGTGSGADFGSYCGEATDFAYADGTTVNQSGLTASSVEGFWIPFMMSDASAPATKFGGLTGTEAACNFAQPIDFKFKLTTGVNATTNALNNVVREAPTLSNATANDYGNIGLGANIWPLIHALDMPSKGDIEFVYEKAGTDETVILNFDDDAEGLTFDKEVYGLNHEVGVTITDWNMNIDPTDEDVWTFGTLPTNATAFYQLYDENGVDDATTCEDDTSGDPKCAVMFDTDSISKLSPAGLLTIDRNNSESTATTNPVINFQRNLNIPNKTDTGNGAGLYGLSHIDDEDQPVTFTETGSNTGVFINWDEAKKTNMLIDDAAKRNTQAVFTYDGDSYGVLHQPQYGSIEYQLEDIGDEWNSGETVEIHITDADMNKDVRSKDQMKSTSTSTVVPAIQVGSPITLSTLDNLLFVPEAGAGVTATIDESIMDTQCSSDYDGSSAKSYISCYEKYSERAIVQGTTTDAIAVGSKLVFEYDGTTVGDLEDLLGAANGTASFVYVQYDFRSLNGGDDNSKYTGNFTFGDDSYGGAAIGDVLFYDATSGAGESIGASTNALFSGLVGNALIQDVDSKLVGWQMVSSAQELTVVADFNAIDSAAGAGFTSGEADAISLDIVSFGQSNDGKDADDRHNNAIYRIEAKETGDNTDVFKAEIDYTMLNQINVNDSATYNSTVAYGKEIVMIVHNDSTDEDEIRTSYLDYGYDGIETQVSDQLAAPTHSGVVEFDSDSYKEADTVTITLTDSDLNTDSSLIDIYNVVGKNSAGAYSDPAHDVVGAAGYGDNSLGENFGRLLEVTFDDERWLDSAYTASSGGACSTVVDSSVVDGLGNSGFSLIESGIASGVFTGTFQIPSEYGARNSGTCAVTSTLGKDLEVNYVDYRDASGEIIEVGDSAGIRANTGSVSLDRTVYPIPFGEVGDFTEETTKSTPNNRSIFPIHSTGFTGALGAENETLGNGDLTIHIRVDDPDYDLSASGEDTIAENTTSTESTTSGATQTNKHGPLKITVSRGAESVVLATAGGTTSQAGVITDDDIVNGGSATGTRQLGPISETAPDSGVFELDMVIRYTDGPDSSECATKTDNWTPTNGDANESGIKADGSHGTGLNAETTRFAGTASSTEDHCILQGDVLTVQYSDQNDASGNAGVAFDSATFDMRNGVLQTDKSVYIIGSDIVMTLIEPDLNLESDEAETWDLDLIQWDSDAATVAMGNQGKAGTSHITSFDPEPSDFRETGDSTGIFQVVIEVPDTLDSTALDRGESIELEYTDYSPSGAKYVGEESTDISTTVYTSNFGATIEMDQKVYTWTDKVYITIVAPDHNFDSNLIDKIGDTDDDPLIIQTRSQKLTSYELAETGTDTGIFSGEVILKGYSYDADGDTDTGTNGNDVTSISSATGDGPTDGEIKATDDDGLTISYEFNEDEVVVGSALIRWNIGETQWLESSYPAGSSGVIRIVDADMNWDPENVDNFSVDVWSSSDQGGVAVTVTETNEATGVFEGTVTFTVDDESSGHRLRVAEGDTITVSYDDNTLPGPDYSAGDSLSITGTAIIGTVVPPLERAPAANARVVDSFGNSLSEVSVDQQVQIEADLVNGQDKDQSFAYLVQVQDESGVTVSLAWITGQLAAGQSFSPALSWIPSSAGTYEATVFVWESVDNPTALSDTVTSSIRVV